MHMYFDSHICDFRRIIRMKHMKQTNRRITSAVMSAAHNRIHPLGIPLNELGNIAQGLVVREQIVHISNAIPNLIIVMVKQIRALLVSRVHQENAL